jgi:Rad3-related DNA helicase
MADGAMDLFPYDIRPIQKRIIQSVERALIDGDHVVIEAGTGSGKTVSALAPSLSFSYRHGKRVLYLTRTNSQQKQVVEEFRRIRESCSSRTIDVDSKKEENADLVDEVMEELNREMRGKVREEEELEDVR